MLIKYINPRILLQRMLSFLDIRNYSKDRFSLVRWNNSKDFIFYWQNIGSLTREGNTFRFNFLYCVFGEYERA